MNTKKSPIQRLKLRDEKYDINKTYVNASAIIFY